MARCPACTAEAPEEQCLVTTQTECEVIFQGTYLGDGTECDQTIMLQGHAGHVFDHWIVICQGFLPPPAPGGGTRECVEDPPYHVDGWVTFGDGERRSCQDFGATCPLPADFFGPGSDPFTGVACFCGVPLGPIQLPGFDEVLDFELADTLARRDEEPFGRFELAFNEPRAIDIELVALSLTSVEPIEVTFDGGQRGEQWRIDVSLDEDAEGNGGLLRRQAALQRRRLQLGPDGLPPLRVHEARHR